MRKNVNKFRKNSPFGVSVICFNCGKMQLFSAKEEFANASKNSYPQSTNLSAIGKKFAVEGAPSVRTQLLLLPLIVILWDLKGCVRTILHVVCSKSFKEEKLNLDGKKVEKS